jgi:Hydrazine synthase alpha subunit middle domain
MRLKLITVALAVLSTSILLLPQRITSASPFSTDLLYTAVTHYEPLAWMQGNDRFSGHSTLMLQGANAAPLVPDFVASADPDISFSADRVLFAGKQTSSDHWQIWELTLSTHVQRQLTTCTGDCVRPLYLPEDRFVYAQKEDGRFILKTAPLGGGKASSVTFVPGNALPTDVLRDGRILFEAAYPLGGVNVAELYTIYTDGSGVEAYRCDHGWTRHSGRQLSSGDIVFTQDRGLARFTSALARELAIDVPTGEYAGDVAEMNSGEWLLARRNNVKDRFRLESWQPGAKATKTVVSNPRADLVQPSVIAARAVPNRHLSALHDWDYANLLCLNSYTSKVKFFDKSIAAIRMYTRAIDGAISVLGTAPVEEDGSFYIRTPADQPLRIELLNASGKTLHAEAGWFWLRRGEQRVCVGCHAGPETAPENRTPVALQRSTIPVDFTKGRVTENKGGN